jgi:predicted small lipoprotein YifL
MRSSFIPKNTWGIILISIFLLEGCGHKGPLMLPEAAIRTSPTQKPIAPASGVPATQPGQ